MEPQPRSSPASCWPPAALLAWWFGGLILQASSVLILIVVALFIAFGLNPVVQWLMRRGIRHSVAVLPGRAGLRRRAGAVRARDRARGRRPGLDADQERPRLLRPAPAQPPDRSGSTRSTTSSTRPRTTSPAATSTQQVFGGVLGVGLAILGVLANTFIVIVLTLYFMASLDTRQGATSTGWPRPAAARPWPSLGDRILDGHRRLRLRRLRRGAVRRPLDAGLPVHRRPRPVRRRAGPRGRDPRRDPDDRRHPGRRHRQRDRPGHRPQGRHRLHHLLHRLPAGRELPDLPAGDVPLGRHLRAR